MTQAGSKLFKSAQQARAYALDPKINDSNPSSHTRRHYET